MQLDMAAWSYKGCGNAKTESCCEVSGQTRPCEMDRSAWKATPTDIACFQNGVSRNCTWCKTTPTIRSCLVQNCKIRVDYLWLFSRCETHYNGVHTSITTTTSYCKQANLTISMELHVRISKLQDQIANIVITTLRSALQLKQVRLHLQNASARKFGKTMKHK